MVYYISLKWSNDMKQKFKINQFIRNSKFLSAPVSQDIRSPPGDRDQIQ